ncbi:hypothetical protein [Spongiactinospora sp. 9N601]|uniref:hypothetical protein n=1 Tax=Spongiactinospora sp. 9N601 TaxID=3375149 RepID=UPI0037A10000
MLVYFLVVLLLSGAFLAFHYSPGGGTVVYTGEYEPLRGVEMSGAYASILSLGFDVPGGLFVRRLHFNATVLLALGTVVWALLGRLRYAPAVLGLGLCLAGALAGFGSADDLLSGTVLGRVPAVVWYGLHLVTALALGVTLVVSARREAARAPRTPGFVALTLALSALLLLWG